jgi:predicted GNAT family acetyltransferase
MMDAWRRAIENGQPLDHEIRNRRADAFLPHTIQMGSYFGIRASDGRLVAMAGERLQSTAFTEISAVCTHPEFRGRGYARGLTTFLAAQMLAVGKTPFLHVKSENGAKVVYQKLGFRLRAAICLTVISLC